MIEKRGSEKIKKKAVSKKDCLGAICRQNTLQARTTDGRKKAWRNGAWKAAWAI